MRDFFISFNKADKDWAEWIAWTLEESDHTVWYQGWDFLPGNNFVLQMHKALIESKQVIAVLSDNFLKSDFTSPEWASAFAADPKSEGRKLLPIRVKECQPDGLLKGILYTDLVGLSEPDAKAAVHGMVLQRGRSRRSTIFPGSHSEPSERVATNAKPFPGPAAPGDSPPPNLGRIVSRSCNRQNQRDLFQETFEASVRDYRTYPQVYVVHGPQRERHKSLIMRFHETTIQDYADWLAKVKTDVAVWESEWSYKIEIESAKQQLIESLIRRSHKDDPAYRFERQSHSVESFRAAIAPLGDSVVIIQHKIEAQKWTRTTGQLIKTYLEFWDQIKEGVDLAQFVIFLNVIYPAPGTAWWKVWESWAEVGQWLRKRKVSSELVRMSQVPGRHPGTPREAIRSLYTVLDELPRVGLSDLVKWFEDHNLGRNEIAWEKQSKNIFSNNGWRFKERKNMAEIETALDEFIEAMQASSNEMTMRRNS